VRRELHERHGIEIGAGAGAYAASVWRIGLMGHNARPDAVLLVLAALQDVLGRG
jgi:alanine-glyoxylate transaminase/serine-glyoxylate transaminase/serine-pyruvate transaminase